VLNAYLYAECSVSQVPDSLIKRGFVMDKALQRRDFNVSSLYFALVLAKVVLKESPKCQNPDICECPLRCLLL
jgi:hypothetical protein